jgi:serine/threonine protein kinase
MTDLTGKELGKYRIFQDVGHGGMATVYRAYDTENDQVVALKVLSPYIAQEPKFKARFAQEIKLLLELRHSHIVPVLDYGEINEFAYIVMPFMTAGTLFQRLWEGPLPIDAAADLLFQISGALDYAHANGVVHRDIKPSNILIDDDGKALLTDFGFARVDDNSLSITGSGIVGTPMYMSPEQCRGDEASRRSDQYAFGVVLYQMLTGRLPYDGDSPLEILVKQATDPLPRPRDVNPDLSRQVERVLLKALSREPHDRFQSMAEFEQEFRSAISQKRESGLVGMLDQPTDIYKNFSKEITNLRSESKGIWKLAIPVAVLTTIIMIAILWGDLIIGIFNLGTSRNGDPLANFDETVTAVSMSLLATIDALNTADAPAVGTFLAPGELETIIAATLDALVSIPDTSGFEETTPTATIQIPLTITPTLTPTTIWIPTPTKTPTKHPPSSTPSPSPSPTATITPTFTLSPSPSPIATKFPPTAPWIPTPTTAP